MLLIADSLIYRGKVLTKTDAYQLAFLQNKIKGAKTLCRNFAPIKLFSNISKAEVGNPVEFAQLIGVTDSITPQQYDQMLKQGTRSKKQDQSETALRCGSCGGKAYLRHTSGLHSRPIFAAYHDPKDCPESSQATQQIDGIITRSRQGTHGSATAIAPNQLDPLNPPPAHKHIKEITLSANEANLPHGKRTMRAQQENEERNRHLAPKTILASLLVDRHRFDDSLFVMPRFPRGFQESLGIELIREFSDLDDSDINQFRYVWGKIHNTHRWSFEKGTRFYLNGADQNNNSLGSSIVLCMSQSEQIMQHFLKTTENSYCSNIWVIAYGKIQKKEKNGGYLLAVYDNWKVHILTKRESSRIKHKEQKRSAD